MATKKKSSGGPWIKSDEILVDTSSAPWMDYAKAELGKKIHELTAKDSFISSMRDCLNLDAQVRATEQQLAKFGSDSLLLGTKSNAWSTERFKPMTKPLPNSAQQLLGKLEAAKLKDANPEINKYFEGVVSDPAYDPKKRSFSLATTYESRGSGRITAWCAAFVNWCLGQAGAPRLGYATAKSWLEFGTPVAYPVYGCITIVKPSTSTGSTTGHVAFFVEAKGNKVVLLGGNQGDAVTETSFAASTVLGYRWPTRINHYLLAGASTMA